MMVSRVVRKPMEKAAAAGAIPKEICGKSVRRLHVDMGSCVANKVSKRVELLSH